MHARVVYRSQIHVPEEHAEQAAIGCTSFPLRVPNQELRGAPDQLCYLEGGTQTRQIHPFRDLPEERSVTFVSLRSLLLTLVVGNTSQKTLQFDLRLLEKQRESLVT